jgi:hypothetical protein
MMICHYLFPQLHSSLLEVRAFPVVLYRKPKSGKRWKDANCGLASIQASFRGLNLVLEGFLGELETSFGNVLF